MNKSAVTVKMEAPVLVDQAPGRREDISQYAITDGAKAWGRYRMPKIYRLPGGDIALTYSMSIDHYYDEGRDSPLFVSTDEGATWAETPWPHPGLSGMHPVVSPIGNGEFYCVPAVNGIRLDEYELPEPFRTYIGPMLFLGYRLADCPREVAGWFRDMKAMRWSPGNGWTRESAQWDHEWQYIWTYDDKAQNIPGNWSQKFFLEHPIVSKGGELYLADYWSTYLNSDGSPPRSWTASLLVSSDNGRSWTRRSTIASLPVDTSEPTLALNQAGELVCVMRSDADDPRTMWLTRSVDSGYTWDEPSGVLGYGVFPRLLQLDNGVMALSYGRAPGTWMAFSLDGGHAWSEPYCIIDEAGKDSSCGYTSLLALGSDTFLLAYGDIHVKNADGEECKSILVRKITVNPA